MLLDLCDIESKVAAAREPLQVDLTGGLAEVDLDMSELAAKAREEMTSEAAEDSDGEEHGTIRALPSPPRGYSAAPPPAWDDLDVDPADLVVIVGGAELGPYGSSRTRFEMEVDDELSAAGVLELAWTTGLVKWEDDPTPGWYDTETGDLVDEGELVERYHDAVVERVGIREFVDDGAIDPDHASPLLVSVFLDKDFTFVVSSEADARAFVEFDPEHTVIAPVPDSGDWQVTRKAGTEIRVPRKTKLSRTVGAQIPTGFDPTVYGVSQDMTNSIDRVALWNLVTTVDAFLSAGLHSRRADALGAPEPGGQHAGHRHGRHDVDADHVPRQPARPEQAERHPAGSPAECCCGARGSVLHRQLRLDDPPGRRVRHRGDIGRGGRRQDPARQGRVRGGRWLRRPDAGGDHRLR